MIGALPSAMKHPPERGYLGMFEWARKYGGECFHMTKQAYIIYLEIVPQVKVYDIPLYVQNTYIHMHIMS